MGRFDDKQLTTLVLGLAKRKKILPATGNMRVVTTVGALHTAIRASLQGEVKEYKYSAVPRGVDKDAAPNSYPDAFRQEVLDVLEYSLNDAKTARDFQISPRTIQRWRKKYNIRKI